MRWAKVDEEKFYLEDDCTLQSFYFPYPFLNLSAWL